MKKISVIIPVYNVEKYLEKCLESVISQSYDNLEIICVNDGSTDSSLKILEKFAQRDARIIIIDNPSGGVSAARNSGLDVATGDFISFIDSDDWIEPGTYEILSKHLDRADVIVFGINAVGNTSGFRRKIDNNYYKIKFSGFKYLSDDERLNIDVSLCNKIFKHSIIKEYNLRLPVCKHYEDCAFYWQYMLTCSSAYFEEAKLYNYFRHEDSIMANTFNLSSNKVLDHLLITEDIYNFMVENDMYNTNRKLFVKIFEKCFRFCLNHQSKDKYLNVLELAESLIKKFDIDDSDGFFIKNLKDHKYYKISTHYYSLKQRLFSIVRTPARIVISVLGLKLSIKIPNFT